MYVDKRSECIDKRVYLKYPYGGQGETTKKYIRESGGDTHKIHIEESVVA